MLYPLSYEGRSLSEYSGGRGGSEGSRRHGVTEGLAQANTR